MENFRREYSEKVVTKAANGGLRITHEHLNDPNALPLPATLTIELAEAMASAEGIEAALVSPWPFPHRTDRTLDSFQTDAMAAFGDGAEEFQRTEMVNGKPMLRYAVPDRMYESCVACHNAHPDTPKNDWKIGDIRGLLEVRIPENTTLAAASNLNLIIIVLIVSGILFIIAIERLMAVARKTVGELEEEVNRSREALLAAKQQARHEAETRGTLLARMSHEIRTPLNGILGMLEMSTRRGEAPDSGQLAVIQASGQQLRVIVDEILDLSKLEAGRIELSSEAVDLREILNNVRGALEPAARKQGIALHATVAPDVPRWVDSDSRRLTQVITNLMSNAVKFTSDGYVRATIDRIVPAGSDRPVIRITVEDTGIGIGPDRLESVFQEYEQAHCSTRFGGTGLGLAICRQVTQLMHGDVSVRSTVGEGTTFEVLAPLSEWDGPTPETEAPPIVRAEGHVLVAEDNVVNQLVTRAALQAIGLTVDIAADGLEAVAMVQNTHYDLVLMDNTMPNLNGCDATRRIRELGFDRLPIVAFTASALDTECQGFRDAGMSGILTKPIELAALHAELRRWLRVVDEAPARSAGRVDPEDVELPTVGS